MESAEVQGDSTAGVPSPTMQKSWVTVAKQKQVLKKYDMEILISEGRQTVMVPSAIVEEANPLWEDFLIA